MKLVPILASLLVSLSFSARAQTSPIHMDIEAKQKTESDGKPTPGKPPQPGKKQVRSLTIRLTNNSTENFDSLVVKYWFLGHALPSHDLKVLKTGERKSSVGPRGKETVESEVVASSYSDAAPGKGKGQPPTPASGEKITGYAVQVLGGEKVLSEYYSELSYKQKIADAGKQPAEPAKPKAK